MCKKVRPVENRGTRFLEAPDICERGCQCDLLQEGPAELRAHLARVARVSRGLPPPGAAVLPRVLCLEVTWNQSLQAYYWPPGHPPEGWAVTSRYCSPPALFSELEAGHARKTPLVLRVKPDNLWVFPLHSSPVRSEVNGS